MRFMSRDEEIWHIYETKDSVVYRTDEGGSIWYKLCDDTWKFVHNPEEVISCRKAWYEYEAGEYI